MVPAVELALQDEGQSDDVRQIVFITDGQVSREHELYGLIEQQLGRSRLFTIGIGHAPNAAFMRHVATLGRGTFTLIPSGSDVAEPMKNLLRAIANPVLRDVQLAWNDLAVDPSRDVLPAPIPDLYAGEPLVVTARIGDSTRLHASGWLRDRHLELTVSLDGGTNRQGETGIHKEWARRRVEMLTIFRPRGPSTDGAEQDVRQQVVDLGLRHQLVTPYTSLVSVDPVRTAKPDSAPNSVPVPVGSSFVAEELIVTSQAPLIDARRTVACSVGVPLAEPLEALPVGPWVALASQPGVRVDRLGFDRLDAGAPSPSLRIVGRAGSTRADLGIEGLEAQLLETIGPEPVYGVFQLFEEKSVNHDIRVRTDGVLVDLTTKRGGNLWRSGVAAHTAIDSESGRGDRVRSDDRSTVEWGGPLRSDHAWLWLGAEGREGRRSATGGDASRHRIWSGMLRADGSFPSDSFLWTLSCFDGERDDRGLGAGPGRAESALFDLDASRSSCAVEGTYVSSSDLFLHAFYARSEAEGTVSGRGGEPVLWDGFAVVHGELGSRSEHADRETMRITGNYFFDGFPDNFFGGAASHEVTFGAASVDGERRLRDRGPGSDGLLPVDGANFGFEGEVPFRFYDPGGSATLDERRVALWLQDTVEWDSWTLQAGLRWDAQDLALTDTGTNNDEGLSWTDASPRVSLVKSFGPERMMQLRVSWARFYEPLHADLLTRTTPGLAGRALFRGETLLDGGGVVWPHRTDPDLEASPSDELALWLDQQLGWSTVVSLGLVHRRQSEAMETRDLVLDGDTLRPSLASDYVFDHTASGLLPDGDSYSVPVFSLRGGLVATGAELLTRGDREVEYDGVTLVLQRRYDQRWSLRGNLHYGEARWRVGKSYTDRRDPTDSLGAGDRDGDPVVTAPEDLDFGFGAWLGGRWSAELTASFSFFRDTPWEFAVAGEIHAREGDPLPYYAWDTSSADGQARRVQATGSVDQFRLDDVLTVDLQVVKVLPDLGPLGALASLEVLNLTSEDAVLVRDLSLSGPRAGLAEETVASRTVRLGLRLSWN